MEHTYKKFSNMTQVEKQRPKNTALDLPILSTKQ